MQSDAASCRRIEGVSSLGDREAGRCSLASTSVGACSDSGGDGVDSAIAVAEPHVAGQVSFAKQPGAQEDSDGEAEREESTESSDSEAEERVEGRGGDERMLAVELVALSSEWAGLQGLEGLSEDSSVVAPRDARCNVGRVVEAAEDLLCQRSAPPPVCAGRLAQAVPAVLTFLALNARMLITLEIAGVPVLDCTLESIHRLSWLWFSVYASLDCLFITFQVCCVHRDRALSRVRLRLRGEQAYVSLCLFELASYTLLGLLSGWQLLRVYRQFMNPSYRDSFLAELNDPGMVTNGALRMPLYSSHLTIILELLFLCRSVEVWTRPPNVHVACWSSVVAAWVLCLSLVVVAVVSLDYNVSSSIRERYANSRWGSSFACAHWVYRCFECVCRFLTIGATYLHIGLFRNGVPIAWLGTETLVVAWAVDILLLLAALVWVEGGFSRRMLFMCVPMMGANLALFADGEGHADTARCISGLLDVVRLTELALAAVSYYAAWQATVRVGNLLHAKMVFSTLVVMLVSAVICVALRLTVLADVPRRAEKASGAQKPSPPLRGRTASASMRNLFGAQVERSLHLQSSEAKRGGLVDTLFSRGIGDQFASLLEIIFERDEVRLSRLETVGKLGQGGFGVVFKVRDTRTGDMHALKLQRKDHAVGIAVREAQCLREIRHAFVVQPERIFHTVLYYGILMELCDRDLNRAILESLSEHGMPEGLPCEQAQHYIACIVVALEHLHSLHIVFRDVKPENVLTTVPVPDDGDGRSHAKLADFGLARPVTVDTLNEDLEHGIAKVDSFTDNAGTHAFMASEERTPGAGGADSSGRATEFIAWRDLAGRDWYAVGCCLMLMLFGASGGVRLSTQRQVLLPPPQEDMHEALLERAADLGEALGPLLALTRRSAAERAGARELRESAFLAEAIRDADDLAQRLMHRLSTVLPRHVLPWRRLRPRMPGNSGPRDAPSATV